MLDADDTLFDFNKAERNALFETLKAISIVNYSEKLYTLYHRINEDLWKDFEEGILDYSDLKVKRFRLLLERLGLDENPERIASLYLDYLSTKDYLLPYTLEVLEYLYKRASLILVSNGVARVQRARIARAGLEVFFQDIIISEEVGLSKPDPDFFFLAAKILQLPLDKILVVGDSPSSDIRGGHQTGLDTCWFMHAGAQYPHQEPEPDYTINNLKELIPFSVDFC